MIPSGLFDSPFVRRVAVAMDVLGVPSGYRDWSVGRDFDRIREYSPLGRFPALAARVARYEMLPVLKKYSVPFDAPQSGAAA